MRAHTINTLLTLLLFSCIDCNAQIDSSRLFHLAGPQRERITDIEVDSHGNIIIAGYFQDSAQFAGTTYQVNEKQDTSNPTGSSSDILLVKMDKDYNIIWQKVLGGFYYSYITDMVIDHEDNIILGVQFWLRFWDGTDTVYGLGENDWNSCVLKFAPDGEKVFNTILASKGEIYFRTLSVNSNDDIIATTVSQTMDTFFVNSQPYYSDSSLSQLIKFSSSGNLEWVKYAQGQAHVYDAKSNSKDELVVSVTLLNADAKFDGTIYPTADTLVRAMLLLYNEDSGIIWQREAKGGRVFIYFNEIEVYDEGEIYSLLFYMNKFKIGNDSLILPGDSVGINDNDFAVCKFIGQGNLAWYRNTGTINSLQSTFMSLGLDKGGDLLIAASYGKDYHIVDTIISPEITAFEDMYVGRMSPEGNLLNIISTKGENALSMTYTSDIAASSNDTVYVSGGINYITSFGPHYIEHQNLDDGFLWAIPNMATVVSIKNQTGTRTLELKIYPNPANNVIRYTLPADEMVDNLLIYNIAGQQVKQSNLRSNTGEVDVTNIKPGMYLLKITSGNSEYTATFLKKD